MIERKKCVKEKTIFLSVALMKQYQTIFLPVLMSILIIANPACAQAPAIEFLPLDYSKLTTRYNVYRQPSNIFTNDYWPIVDYQFHAAWVQGVYVNFFLKNSGGSGEVVLTARSNNEKMQPYTFEAGKSYIVRIYITLGATPPWPGSGGGNIPLTNYPVSLTVGSETKETTFSCTPSSELAIERIIVEELIPEEVEVSQNNFPDEELFADTTWYEQYDKSAMVNETIKFREDGHFGYIGGGIGKYSFDRNKWKIESGELVLSYNNDFVTCRYRLTSKDAKFFIGSCGKDNIPRKLLLAEDR
jgi:hypothetical protein